MGVYGHYDTPAERDAYDDGIWFGVLAGVAFCIGFVAGQNDTRPNELSAADYFMTLLLPVMCALFLAVGVGLFFTEGTYVGLGIAAVVVVISAAGLYVIHRRPRVFWRTQGKD